MEDNKDIIDDDDKTDDSIDESLLEKTRQALADAFSGFSEKDMENVDHQNKEGAPLKENDDKNTDSEKAIPQNDLRKTYKLLMFIFMFIVIICVDIAAIFGILNNLEELKTLPDTELSYYLAIVDLFANILEIFFTISLILPGRKKFRHIRFQRRISYFLNMMIGFAVSLLITNVKEFYPHLNESDYINKNIPLLIMLGIVLLFIVFAKLKIEAKTAKTKELIIYLYIFSTVIFIYQVFSLIIGNTDIEEILHLIMAIFSLGFIFFYHKIAPKKMMDKRHAWLYDYGDGVLLVYSKAIVNVKSVKVSAVFSGIFGLLYAFSFILNILFVPELKEQWDQIISAREFKDIFGLGLVLSFITLLLSIICIFRFFSCLKQNNAKKIMLGQSYVGFMSASLILFCQFSSKGFEDYIDGQLPFAIYLTLALLPFLFIKAAIDQHDIKAFESCTGPLEWGTLLSIVLMIFAIIGSKNYSAITGVISLVLNYIFLLKVRSNGFLEYEKADEKDIDETVTRIKA